MGGIDGIAFDFCELETVKVTPIMSRKGAELGYVLLLDTNRKSHMESPATPSHWVTLYRQNQGH